MADLIYNQTGQKLTVDVWNEATSVTSLQVWPMSGTDDDTVESAFGTPTVESHTPWNIDDFSGPGGGRNPRHVKVNSTAGVAIGRRYLVRNSNKESEIIEVVEIDANDFVVTRHPLANVYANGDDFETLRLEATVDATWIADANNISDDTDPNPGYRARWTYVDADSNTRVIDTYFDVVRYQGQHNVKPIDVDLLVPGWLDSLPPEHREDRGVALIDQAYSEVVLDFHEFELPDEMLRNRDIQTSLVVRKAILLAEDAKMIMGSGTPEGHELAERRYQARLDKLLKVTNKATVATGTGGGGSRPTSMGFWEK